MPYASEVYPFAISLLVGLMVGIERERSQAADDDSAGVRTFVLIGLLGALAAKLDEPGITAVFGLFTMVIVVAGYLRSTQADSKTGLGVTTEISAMCTFGLGILSGSNPGLSLLLGVVVFTVLYSRTWLHRFSREVLQPAEIRAMLILAIILTGILPLLPVDAIDPWGIFRPQSLAKIIVALLVIQFAGHIAIRTLGSKRGILLTGFLGGFVSSTGLFLTLPAKLKRDPSLFNLLCCSALLAITATLAEVLVILLIVDERLLYYFAVPVAMMVVTTGAFILWLNRYSGALDRSVSMEQTQRPSTENETSPIDLVSVLKLSAVISAMLIAVSISNKWLGPAAATATAFLGALFELHGVTFSTAEIFTRGIIPAEAAALNIAVAISAAFFSKVLILMFLNRGRFAFVLSGILMVILAAGAGTFILSVQFLR